MNPNKITTRRLLSVFFLVFVLVFGAVQTAKAQGVIYGENLPAGETVDNDLVLSGNNVVLDGTVVGDVLAVGSVVQINGVVKGSLVILSQDATINGEVEGTVYVVGFSLNVGSSAVLQRNLYYLGLSMTLLPGSSIGRDLVGVSLFGARLEGEIGRSIRAVIGPLELVKRIIETIGGQPLPSGTGLLDREALDGKYGYPARVMASTKFSGINLRMGEGLSWISSPQQVNWQAGQIDTVRLREWIEGRLRELISLLLVGLLMIWISSPRLVRAAQALRQKPLPVFGYGLLALIIAFNLFALAILLMVLFFALGTWLGAVAPWDISLTFWGVFLSALGLATSLLALYVLYVTKVIVAYLVGLMVLKPLGPKASRYKIVPLLVGLIVYVLLHSIPTLGWVIGVIVTALGLGATVVLYLDVRIKRKQLGTLEVS